MVYIHCSKKEVCLFIIVTTTTTTTTTNIWGVPSQHYVLKEFMPVKKSICTHQKWIVDGHNCNKI